MTHDTDPERLQEADGRRPHELATFMEQDAAEMQSEYDRIRSIASEDPGTAGDEGEETWANLLREWLPDGYHVVTKGRLLASSGARGPQVDVIVLRPGYPKRLMDKKLYLLGGVVAAFECKNTLRPEHVKRSFDQAARIDSLSGERKGTLFAEAVPEIFFGLLAHSTAWSAPEHVIRERLDGMLQDGLAGMANQRACPGLLCVADLCCWSILRLTYDGPGAMPSDAWAARKARAGLPDEGAASVNYMRHVESDDGFSQPPPNAIAAATAAILGRLAHGDASVRALSQYFFAAGLQGSGQGVAGRHFLISDYSTEVQNRLPNVLTNGLPGSEWGIVYQF